MPKRNRLLACLPDDIRAGLLASAHEISFKAGDVLIAHEGVPPYVVFPVSGSCSLLVRTRSGGLVETGSVGSEGMLGLAVPLGADFEVDVSAGQIAGQALKIRADRFREAMRKSPALDAMLRRYIAYTWRVASQSVACNALHTAMQRTCRWLLSIYERIGRASVVFTHQQLAEMVAAQRQTLTVIAGELRRAGLIEYQRGALRIVSPDGLRARSCECYAVLAAAYRRTCRAT